MSRPKRLISNIPFVTALLTLGSVSFATFAISLAAVSLASWAGGFEGIWVHAGLLGQEILSGATWLLPSFIGALFVIAVIPHDESGSRSSEYVSLREGLTRFIPFVVGVLTLVTFVFCIIGAVANPGTAYELYAVSAISFVILGTSLALVTGTFSLPSLRLREAAAALKQIQSALLNVEPIFIGGASRSFAEALRSFLATTVLSAFLGWAVLAIRAGVQATLDWRTISYLVGFAVLIATVSFVSQFLWLVSSRGFSDRLLALYVPGVVIGGAAVIVFSSFSSAVGSAGEAVALSLIPLVTIPFFATWVRVSVPDTVRKHTLRNASAIAAYRYLWSRRQAAESDLLALGASKPDEEDRSIRGYLGLVD